MADEQNTGGNTAANKEIKTTGDVFEAAREYKQTKDALEALEKQEAQPVFVESMPQDAQEQRENNEKQRIFDDNGIEIDPELQAKLDPISPQLYREYTAPAITAPAMQRLKVSLDNMRSSLLDVMKASSGADTMQGVVEILQDAIAPLADIVKQTVASDGFKRITGTLQYIVENSEAIQANLEEWEQLKPFLEAELLKPEYNGLTLDELIALDETDENGDPIENSLFEKAFAAATAAQIASKPQTTTIKRAELLEMPLDKVNATIWNLLEKDTGGQLAFAMEKRGSNKEITLLYSIDFDETLREGIQITKRLLPFDKRVYIAVNALFNAGNNIITLTQIYYAMGYKGKPGTKDLQKIQASIIKMQGAQISVDNAQEAATYKKYGKFVYKGSLLPLETAEHYSVNGALTDAAIHIFREPPLISFAKQRNQITTVEIKLLQSPINKTDNNLLIDDYLIERISRMKNSHGKSSNKILFNTIFDNARITAARQKQRSKATIKRYLDHYKQCGFIKDYKEAADGVTIIY